MPKFRDISLGIALSAVLACTSGGKEDTDAVPGSDRDADTGEHDQGGATDDTGLGERDEDGGSTSEADADTSDADTPADADASSDDAGEPDAEGEARGVVHVAIAENHACQVIRDGTVECWGANDYYKLGDRTGRASATPVGVQGLAGRASQVAVGTYHSCALLVSGDVQCWGRNNSGQLGYPGVATAMEPVTVSLGMAATGIDAGGNVTCVLLADTTSACWGTNGRGELGSGANTPTNSAAPLPVFGVSGAVGITVSANGGASQWSHGCAVLNTGAVRCWGHDYSGQLTGSGPVAGGYTATPLAVAGLDTAQTVAAGAFHTCAVLAGGSVECWGANTDAQLGRTASTQGTRMPVADFSDVTALCAGDRYTCAVRGEARAVECWGRNDANQLGDGTGMNSSSPVPVAGGGIDGVVSLACGADFSCAILDDGQKRCWGTL